MEVKEMEAAIEGILFAAGDPVGVERLCLALEQDRNTVDGICRRLADRFSYERRGVRIVQLDASWQMCSAPEYAPLIRKTLESRRPAKLSQPALEVLAIIAYFQPVTRAYVDQVRGVDSAYTVGLLLERELIEEAGRLAVPGRPIQYRTTKNFLRTFGLTKLDELPELPGSVAEDGQLTLEGLGSAAQQSEKPGAAAETPERSEKPDAAAESPERSEKPGAAAETPKRLEKPDAAAETPERSEKPDAATETPERLEKPDAAAETPEQSEKPDAAAEPPERLEKPGAAAETPERSEKPDAAAETPERSEKPDAAAETVDPEGAEVGAS